MNIYEKKTRWKLLLLLIAIIIVSVSLWYTNQLAKKLAVEEKKKAQLWADAYKQLNTADENTDITFLFEVIRNNQTVPVILTDEAETIIAFRNLDSLAAENDENYLKQQLDIMRAQKLPIEIEIGKDRRNYIYYKDSFLLNQLRYYPYIQLCIISLFLLVSYLAFSTARKAEQNQVWVGMSKETAHQLGTPISSLLGWLEFLKTAKPEAYKQVLTEIEKDVKRLEQVTERFSKIGAPSSLKEENILHVVTNTVRYIKKRASDKVQFSIQASDKSIAAKINATLFDWVIENLLKNALNAMNGKGKINITMEKKNDKIIIDVNDTGKGIAKSNFKNVFKPGFTTRKRGWGLGLSLSKRIIEDYHKGKILVKESTLEKETTFRIIIYN